MHIFLEGGGKGHRVPALILKRKKKEHLTGLQNAAMLQFKFEITGKADYWAL